MRERSATEASERKACTGGPGCFPLLGVLASLARHSAAIVDALAGRHYPGPVAWSAAWRERRRHAQPDGETPWPAFRDTRPDRRQSCEVNAMASPESDANATGADRIDVRRYRRITRFFARSIIGLIWWELVLARLVPGRVKESRPARLRSLARSFRELAVEMGGVMIKAGQFLSSRVDVLPPEITQELAGLQDEVPPADFREIEMVIESELGRPAQDVFHSLDPRPQAAASLGQVHRAKLDENDVRDVVVKVQRPGIERLVATDLAAFRSVARWLMLYPPIRRRADMPALVREFSRTTWDELDYEKEAANARRFAEMFAEDPVIRIPSIEARLTTRRVLTLEDVEAIKITDRAAIDEAGVDRREVAAKLFDTYLHQIFEEGFFHADPHPGNIFVQPKRATAAEAGPTEFAIAFVDFGMVGRLPPTVSNQLRQVLLGLATRDSRRIVMAAQSLGLLLPSADLDKVERALTRVLDRYWGLNLAELTHVDYEELGELAIEFRDLLFELPFQVPGDFVFLGRAVGILGGLSTSLDPEFNPWRPIESYASSLVVGRSRLSSLKQGLEVFGSALEPLLIVPGQMERFLRQANQGDLEVRVSPTSRLELDLRRLSWAAERLFWGMVFAALLVAGTWLYVSGFELTGTVMWAGAALGLFRGLVIGKRH